MRLSRWLNGLGEGPPVWLAVISADSQIDRLLDEASQAVNEWSERWDPQCNIFEDSDEFTVQMALPGMNGAITDYAPICVLSIGARGWRGFGSVPSPHKAYELERRGSPQQSCEPVISRFVSIFSGFSCLSDLKKSCNNARLFSPNKPPMTSSR